MRAEPRKPSRIIVCGGRRFGHGSSTEAKEARRIITHALLTLPQDATIVHGDAPGADRTAAKIAQSWGMTVEPHPAKWHLYGKQAGPKRNAQMVGKGADLLIAFPGGTGTADCVRRAEEAGIPVRREPESAARGSST